MDRIYQKYLGWIIEHGLVGIDSEKNPAKSKQDRLKNMYTVYKKNRAHSRVKIFLTLAHLLILIT